MLLKILENLFQIEEEKVISKKKDKKNKKDKKCKQCKDGLPGKDGIDGLPGRNGVNGLPGRNGVNGLPGIDGLHGKDGLPGKDGINGLPGIDGLHGKDGKDGKDGINGLHGKDGLQGLPGTSNIESINVEPTTFANTLSFNSKTNAGIKIVQINLEIVPKMKPFVDLDFVYPNNTDQVQVEAGLYNDAYKRALTMPIINALSLIDNVNIALDNALNGNPDIIPVNF